MSKPLTKNQRYGINTYQLHQLRGQVAFLQDFKCWGCDNPLIPKNGYSVLHHKNGKPKDNRIVNIAVCCPLCHYDSHGWRDSVDRGLRPKRKIIGKKEAIRRRIIPLGGV